MKATIKVVVGSIYYYPDGPFMPWELVEAGNQVEVDIPDGSLVTALGAINNLNDVAPLLATALDGELIAPPAVGVADPLVGFVVELRIMERYAAVVDFNQQNPDWHPAPENPQLPEDQPLIDASLLPKYLMNGMPTDDRLRVDLLAAGAGRVFQYEGWPLSFLLFS